MMNARWLSIPVFVSLVAVLALQPALAAPLAAPAMDGDGLMDVAPTSIDYGTSSSYTFTFTANADFGQGSQVDLTIPTGWTTPTTAAGAGHVSVSSGTCTLSGSPPFGITPPDIFVDMASCTTGQYFTITYSGSPPGVTGSPFTFLTQTDIGPGGSGLVPINAGSPTVTVNPKTLTVSSTGLTPSSKIYDGTTAAALTVGSPSLIGVLPADVGSVGLDTSAAAGVFADRNAGSTKIVYISGLTLNGAKAGNYTLTQPTRFANIAQSPITITAATDTKTYDGTTGSSGLPTITNGGIKPGDTEPTWTQTFGNRNAGTNKSLTPAGVVNDGNSGLNYSYTYAAVTTGTINKMPISVTAVTSNKPYDRTTSSSGHPTLTGGAIQTGDTEPSWTQTYDTSGAGTNKALTPAGAVIDGNSGNNYSYTFVKDYTGVITPKVLTVSSTGLTPANKVYDGTTTDTGTAGSPTLVGVISGDTVTLVTSGATYTFADKNAGNGKLVHVGGLTLGGVSAANYSLTQPDRTANISPRSLGITAVTDSREYDGTNHSNGAPSLTSGAIQPGDVAPVWTQTFADKHVGTGKSLIPAGVVVDGNSGNNYSYTYVHDTTGVITPRAVSITAITDTRTYDGTTHSADIPNYTPAVVGSDTPAFTQAFNTKDVGTGKTITPAGVVNDGNSGLDYSYTYNAITTGTINALAITVTAVTDHKTYDASTASSVAPSISPPLVGTDTSGFSQTFDTKDIGTNKTLTPSGLVNDGNGGNNYTYTFTPVSTGIIDVRPITVTADPQSRAIGALDPPLTYTVNPALFGLDTFSGALSCVHPEAAGSYPITQGTLDAGTNYSITYVGANLLIGPAIAGTAGVGGAVLSWTDTTPKTVTADIGGNYSLIVSYNWAGTITPSKAGYVFTPSSRTYSGVTADMSTENYKASPLVTVTLPSTGTQDGWILESSETSNMGGSMNSNAVTFNLGDDASNKQYKAILSFNTTLPGTAHITAVTLKFRKGGQVGANPFKTLGNLLVDLRKGPFSGNSALQIVDFQALASKASAMSLTNSPTGTGWYVKALASANFGYINKAGVTQFRLRFAKDDNNNHAADYLKFYSGNAASANKPVLIITYYVP